MKIAIVIKLSRKIDKKIKSLKRQFKIKYKKCLYVNDFPHITLTTMSTKLNLTQLKKMDLSIKMKPVKVTVIKSNIFNKDFLTGGRTFFFDVKKDKKLFILQKKVCNYFKKFKMNIKLNKVFSKNSQEQKSFKKFGFPYVGKHWIPHITICSVLDKKINIMLEKKFKKTRIKTSFLTDEIYISLVKKDSLKIIKRIKFEN